MLPQIPLTLTNAIIVTAAVSRQLLSELPADDAIGRKWAAAADQEIDRDRQYEQLIFAATLGPEEAADIRRKIYGVDHENCDRKRRRTRE